MTVLTVLSCLAMYCLLMYMSGCMQLSNSPLFRSFFRAYIHTYIHTCIQEPQAQLRNPQALRADEASQTCFCLVLCACGSRASSFSLYPGRFRRNLFAETLMTKSCPVKVTHCRSADDCQSLQYAVEIPAMDANSTAEETGILASDT